MSIGLDFAARTDIGLGRYTNNQDSAYAGPHLLVVADGMGGHAAGDVASSMAIARLVALDEDAPGGDALELLTNALAEANQDLRDRVAAEPEHAGMGTTVTALLRSGAKLALAHIGDSRGYLLRAGQLTQITHDHTFVQSLVDEGRITEDEARTHPQRNLITRVLTGERDDTPDLSVREAKVGDVYLLCSDGLTGVLTEDTLSEVLGDGRSVGERAEHLLALALKGGAADNVTCIVAEVVDLDNEPAPPDVPEVVGAAAVHQVVQTGADPQTPAGAAAELTRAAQAGSEEPTGAAGDGDAPHAGPDDGSSGEEPEPLVDARLHRGRRRLAGVLVLLIALALVGGGGYAAYGWSQRQYYVGTNAGDVAIYKGVPQSVGPISLSQLYERQSDLPVVALPTYWREQVQQHISATDLTSARAVVTNLREQAASCATASPSTSATATSTATASSSATARTTTKATTKTTSRSTGRPTKSATTPTATGSGSPTSTSTTGTATATAPPPATPCGAG